mmetsp:Transcript_41696/g.116186  ORF Transcript_41696/g.116186 Transcript_41696/m.116186 type:complete len:200 (-) Transcript_41696:866-1465(-)
MSASLIESRYDTPQFTKEMVNRACGALVGSTRRHCRYRSPPAAAVAALTPIGVTLAMAAPAARGAALPPKCLLPAPHEMDSAAAARSGLLVLLPRGCLVCRELGRLSCPELLEGETGSGLAGYVERNEATPKSPLPFVHPSRSSNATGSSSEANEPQPPCVEETAPVELDMGRPSWSYCGFVIPPLEGSCSCELRCGEF